MGTLHEAHVPAGVLPGIQRTTLFRADGRTPVTLLLESKLKPPPLGSGRVPRQDLFDSLDDFESGVVLVSAPPGFGKSTFVVEWVSEQRRPFAWYSLDRYDSDIGLFGEYLGRAVGELIGHESGLISLPGEQTPDARTITAALSADLQDAPARSVLVLDDYHLVEGLEVPEALGYFVHNLPDGLVLVVVTRADPPLPLSKLRAGNRLREIRGADLRFSRDQIADFFRRADGVEMDTADIEAVAGQSEGWVSALQLINLGRDSGDTGRAAATASPQTHIGSYLVDEVLERLPGELGEFLLATSPLERFDAGLCREVSGIERSADHIVELVRQNAFIIPLGDGDWYRYHHLFADLLRSRLERSDPARHRDLLIAAARAASERNMVGDSIEYALRAGDVGLAGDIVDEKMGQALGAGEVSHLRSWLRLFPTPSTPATHLVTLAWAWCRIFEGNDAAAYELIDLIERSMLEEFEVDPRGQLEVMRSMVAFQEGDLEEAEARAKSGLGLLNERSMYLESVGHLYMGRSLHAQGRRLESRTHLERAAALAERGNTLAAVTAVFWLGVVDMDLGNLLEAELSMMRAQEIAVGASGGERLHPVHGIGDIGLAYIRLNQLLPTEAAELAERGTRLLERSTFVEMVFRGYFVWAEALSIDGRFDESHEVSQEGIDWLKGRNIGGGPLETWLNMTQARNYWRRGRLDDARSTLAGVRAKGLGSPNSDETQGFYESADAVALELRAGDADQARALFDEMPSNPTANVMFAIKTHVLEAALHEVEGDKASAVRSVEQALALGEQGYQFQFSFVAPVIAPTLQRMLGRSEHDNLLRSIVERLPGESDFAPQQPIDPLTDREIDVLAEIAAGYNNEEIADRLFISRGTVKRHASNIYLKLGVHHRAEAAARGRELGLIN